MDSIAHDLRVSDNMIYVEEFDALLVNVDTSTSPKVSKYPAKQHARSVAKHLGIKEGLIYLLGQSSRLLEDSDMPMPFRQRRYFYYLSGADFEDCIVTYDIEKDDLRLHIPPVNPLAVVWLGPTPSVEECKKKYDVDYVCLTSDIDYYITNWLRQNKDKESKIYILHADQGPGKANLGHTGYDKNALLNWKNLRPAMDAARVIKSDYEIELIRRANNITSLAHRSVLENIKDMTNETEIEARFGASCVSAGAKKQAYEVIAGSGENASILHYVANNQPLKDRQLVCLDAGCEWECYASDVTRTFPIDGFYSQEAKEIYSIVKEMQERCIERIKPGVVFRDLHVLAMKIAAEGLLKLGILHNGTFEEILPTVVAFFPHGLGHHLGLETHDVSYNQHLLAEIPTLHDLQRQRFPIPPALASKPYDRRQALKPNMVITVEPGIYFSRYALTEVYLKSPQHARYINAPLLSKYYPVGGVRIEDDILVTAESYEVLTTAPKGEEACIIIRQGLQAKGTMRQTGKMAERFD